MKKNVAIFFILAVARQIFGQTESSHVSGRVVDANGQPLTYANVQIIGFSQGDATNADGDYYFTTTLNGVHKLRASMLGFESVERTVRLRPGDTTRVDFILQETLITLQEATVTASAFTANDDGKGVTLRRMEVVTTPGAAADIFLTIKTFPGLSMMDEGSGLFVRGGDVTETVTLLDQATVAHPYKYESPTGGVFGTISPFLVKGTFFSSGGFSARYGNALSGVLALESEGMPEQTNLNLNLGLAAVSLGANAVVAHDKLGVRFSGNQSFTDVMFRLNGRHDEFTQTPSGKDGNLSLIIPYSNTGQFKLFNFLASNRIGVHVDLPSLRAVYTGDERNALHNLQWSEVLANRWLIKSSLSLNRYRNKSELGNLNFRQEDATYKWRTDVEARLSRRWQIRFGGEVEEAANRFNGRTPRGSVMDPNAPTYAFDEKFSARRFGGYSEIETQISRRVLISLGLRADHHTLAAQTVSDPRLSLRYELSKTANLRVSWGIYHQFPQPFEFNAVSGNPGLKAQHAQHLIVGYEFNRETTQVRIEGYHKNYRRLVLSDAVQNFTNHGAGEASGVDFFVKYGGFLKTPIHGWASYSFLQSRRLQARDLGFSPTGERLYFFEKARSGFDITHNFTIVAKLQIFPFLNVGCTYRYATGRPITPIVGAIKDDEFEFFTPIEGPVNSERLPNFQRLDANLSYYHPYGRNNFAVFYLSVANLLDRDNVLDYDYSLDYSVRTPRRSNYRRFIYFGVTTTLAK